MNKFSGKRELKEKAKFTALARCPLGRLPDSFLAKASLTSLKSLLPEGQEKFPDLLAIAGNAFVANLINGNGDSISTEDALLLYPTFVNKPINLEHDAEKIVGTITKSFLTAFDSNYKLGAGSEPIEESAVKDSQDPFNVAIGGYVYADIFPHIAEKVQASNDPESSDYLTVSFSWEVAFDKWNLLVGSREYASATVISDEAEVEKWTPYLKSKGGSGNLPDGRVVSRQIVWAKDEDGKVDPDSLYGVGMALTMAPAGQVRGVVTEDFGDIATASIYECPKCGSKMGSTYPNGDTVRGPACCTSCSYYHPYKDMDLSVLIARSENNQNNISVSEKIGVTENTNIQMKSLKTIDDVKALNDENAKEFSFANIANVLDAGVNKLLTDTISEKAKAHEAELEAKKNELADTKKLAEDAQASVAELSKKNSELEIKLNELVQAQQVAAASQTFNERMTAFDTKYELTDADRKAIASRIKGLSQEDFEKVASEELEVLLAPKDKAVAKEKAKASAEEPTAAQIAQDALDKAVASDKQQIPNSVSDAPDIAEKYKNAFSLENITKSTK